MWRGPPSLAQLPGRCRRTRPQRAPPPRARPGGGRGLGAARARSVRLFPGGRLAGNWPASPRACACVAEKGGLRVAERAWATAAVCLCARIRVVCGWGGSECVHAPCQVGLQAGGWDPRGPRFLAAKGSACGWAHVCLCGITGPRTFPERLLRETGNHRGGPALMLRAQADLPGGQPAV